MELLEQIKAVFFWLPTEKNVVWDGWGTYVVSIFLSLAGAAALWFISRCHKPKAISNPPDLSALLAGSVLTIDKYKEHLLEQHGNYFQEKQKREEIERKLANLEESHQETLRLLKESQEKLLQLAGSLPKEQLAEAEERLAQGDTELAELLFDRVAAETGQTAAAALLQSGRLAEDRLDYSKALRNYTAAVALAPDNSDYLLPAGQMARTMGDYQRAQEWLEHLLAIREQAGKENAELALALNDLALVYEDQGRHEEAEPLYKRSLEIREQMLGKDHPDVAESLNNLAELYRTHGRYEDAEPLHSRSLNILEKVLGKEHPNVATILNNLTLLYESQARYEEAEPLCQRSLEIKEKVLGKEHPDVAVILNTLALLYESQGRCEDAEPLYKRSLEIKEKTLGKDHPDVATTLNNLAWLYYSQRRYEEARPLYQRALAIFKAKFPNGHPNIDTFQVNYNKLKEKMQAR